LEFTQDDKPTLRHLIKEGCKRFGHKEKYRTAKIYNKNGILLSDDDVSFIKADDVLYVALEGKSAQESNEILFNCEKLSNTMY